MVNTMKADLRFHADLRDFLDKPARSSGRVAHFFNAQGSVKDAIESHGIPHTEVARIVVDRRSVDFTYQVADGDRIDVYSVSELLDVAPTKTLCPPAPNPVRFVLDGHLRRLSHYLRLIGFDTVCEGAWNDDDLVSIQAREDRILLTRDVGLLKRSAVVRGAYIRATDPHQQLVEVVRRFHLARRLDPFTRCLECNGVLSAVDKDEVAGNLPPRTRELFDDYVMCPACRRVYWQGSHFARLTHIVQAARDADQAAAASSLHPLAERDHDDNDAGREL